MADPEEIIPLRHRLGATWEPIPGHQAYFVSTDGNVYSSKNGGKMLTPYPNQSGEYLIVKLHDGKGGHDQRSVHSLVLEAFRGIPDSDERNVAHHKDGDPRNNELENLTWVTAEQNAEQARTVADDSVFSPTDPVF